MSRPEIKTNKHLDRDASPEAMRAFKQWVWPYRGLHWFLKMPQEQPAQREQWWPR